MRKQGHAGKDIRDQLLEEAYLKEAEDIEKALLPEEELQNCASGTETRASYRKLVERLKAEGCYREEEPSEKAPGKSAAERLQRRRRNLCSQRTKRYRATSFERMTRNHRLVRTVGLAFVSFLGLLALDMTEN